MTAHDVIIGLVVIQRLGELVYARRNERRLITAGGVEVGADHYPLIVAVHAGWLLTLAILVPRQAAVDVPLLGVYIGLQVLRLWIMTHLGKYWTTRVIDLPGAPLVRSGPYRFFRHPNYLVVTCEIALLPLVFGAWGIAAVFSLLNLCVLARRIAIENAALGHRRIISSVSEGKD